MARRKNTRFIDPRYFMDEKMERLGEEELEKSLREYAQAEDAPEPEGGEFPPDTRVRYKDGPPGAEIVGKVQGLSKKYPDYIRVKWERSPEFINARGQERPGHPSGPKATVSDVDPRLLSRVKSA